ncbi:MAG: restriction endonuclease subunit S [Cyclobacteriaceae bacterium]
MNQELGSLFEITSSKRVFQSEWKEKGIPFLRAREVVQLSKTGQLKNEISISEEMYSEYAKKFGVPQIGDILVTGVGTLGITYLVKDKRKFYFKDGNIIWLKKKSEKVYSEYVEYAFKSSLIRNQIERSANGATVGTFTITNAKQVQILLPPLPIQQKIAEVLDTADRIRRRNQQILDKYDQLAQSVFLEMFGDISENKKFNITRVGDMVKMVKDGPHVSPKYSEDKDAIPILSTRNIRPFELVLDEVKYVSRNTFKELTSRFRPQKGDVLLTKGGTTGYAKIVDFDWDFCIWVHLAALRPDLDKVHPKYLEGALNSHYCYYQSQRFTRGIANRDLGLTRMINIQLPNPPLNLQNQFASIIEKIEQQKQHAKAELDKSEELFGSLLQKAFNGGLFK